MSFFFFFFIVNNSNIKAEMSDIRKGLENVVQAVENIKPSKMIFDENGIAVITNIIEEKKRRRDKL